VSVDLTLFGRHRLQDFNPDGEPKGATFYYLTVKKIKELIRSD
jgi:hypothetical protein